MEASGIMHHIFQRCNYKVRYVTSVERKHFAECVFAVKLTGTRTHTA